MPIRATFISHSIRPDGLHILSVTSEGKEIETVVPYDEAISLGWAEYPHITHAKHKQDLAQLEAWNRLVNK